MFKPGFRTVREGVWTVIVGVLAAAALTCFVGLPTVEAKYKHKIVTKKHVTVKSPVKKVVPNTVSKPTACLATWTGNFGCEQDGTIVTATVDLMCGGLPNGTPCNVTVEWYVSWWNPVSLMFEPIMDPVYFAQQLPCSSFPSVVSQGVNTNSFVPGTYQLNLWVSGDVGAVSQCVFEGTNGQ